MIDYNVAELIHKQIILDLTIRTLERDRKHISDLKINRPLELWMDQQVKELHNELKNVKSTLNKNGIKIQSENKVDKLITEYTVLDKGTISERRYMNVALKNWVDEEVKRLLNLSYKNTDSGNWAK